MSSDDVLAQITPRRNCRLALPERNGKQRRICLHSIHINYDREHNDRSQMTHSLLRHSQQQCSILAELNPLDRRREIPSLEGLSCLYIPYLDGVIGSAGGKEGARGINIDGP